jgi:hypothetical protein
LSFVSTLLSLILFRILTLGPLLDSIRFLCFTSALLIDSEYLMATYEDDICNMFVILLKIYHSAGVIEAVTNRRIDDPGELLLDSDDPHKFLLRNKSQFILGHVTSNQIHLDDHTAMQLGELKQSRFHGNLLSGRRTKWIKYDESAEEFIDKVDLANGERTSTEIPDPSDQVSGKQSGLVSTCFICVLNRQILVVVSYMDQ